jgi:hypothetical protein
VPVVLRKTREFEASFWRHTPLKFLPPEKGLELNNGNFFQSKVKFAPEGGPELSLKNVEFLQVKQFPLESFHLGNKKISPIIFVSMPQKAPIEFKVISPQSGWNEDSSLKNFMFQLTASRYRTEELTKVHFLTDSGGKGAYLRVYTDGSDKSSIQYMSINPLKLLAGSKNDRNEKQFIRWILNHLSFSDKTFGVQILPKTGISVAVPY